MLGGSSKILPPPAKLKPAEEKIFAKEYHLEQNVKSVKQTFIDEQRMVRTQRELETQKRFLQQELDISKKQMTTQKDDYERGVEEFKQEMMYKHREELDRAQRRVVEKESEVDSLRKLMEIQQQQMDQLLRQFEDLKLIRQKEAVLEKRQKDYDDVMRAMEDAQKKEEEKKQIYTVSEDPFENRSLARSPKKPVAASGFSEAPKPDVQKLETQIKEDMDNIEAKMRETQNKMKMLERERDAMKKKQSTACSVF